jgi:hypothetical protein
LTRDLAHLDLEPLGSGDVLLMDAELGIIMDGCILPFPALAELHRAIRTFRLAAEASHTSILPFRMVVPNLHDGVLIIGVLFPRASAEYGAFPGGVS